MLLGYQQVLLLHQTAFFLSLLLLLFHFQSFGQNQRLNMCLKKPKHSENAAPLKGTVTQRHETAIHNQEHIGKMLQYVVFLKAPS